MIFDAATLPPGGRIRADLCVVGSGPGGATAAAEAAEAGLKVVVLEAGGLVTPHDATQREDEMVPRLYWHAGARTTDDRAVRVHQGKGVGGSSIHNINLCKRIPEVLRAEWAADRGLHDLTPAAWDALYSEVELQLAVQPIPEVRWNVHNKLFDAARRSLGWRGGGLSHNRTNCISSGFCELGCAYDAKNNALKVFVPRLLEAAGQVITHCQAVRVDHAGGAVRGVDAAVVHPVDGHAIGQLRVDAPRVCLSASATGTAALLRRSGVPDPGGETGEGLRLHPGLAAVGEMEDRVVAWEGIPQSAECTEWLDFRPGAERRVWILPAFGHPMAFASMLPGHGPAHRARMERYPFYAAFSAMLHDHTAGSVGPKGDLDVSVRYWPDAADRKALMFGLWACVELLFAAGARRVLLPTRPIRVIERGEPYAWVADLPLQRGVIDVTAVHPMGTVPMGADPAVAAVDSHGRHHHVRGLWVSDGSLFPTSVGVPPQLSIYALGLRVGRAIAAS